MTAKATETATGRRNGAATNRRERKSLQRASAVATALELAEREGASALTMRRLGEELNVDPTTLYRIFRDKDELLLALYDKVLEVCVAEFGDTAARDWPDGLRHIADCIWRVNGRYPAITALTFARTTGGPAERRGAETILATVARAGLPRPQTALYYRVFIDAVLAMCGQAASLRILEPDVIAKDTSAWARVYAQLPETEYPAARTHIAELLAVEERQVYDAVVDSIIGAIEAAAAGHS